MPFLPPNQQRQSTESTELFKNKKMDVFWGHKVQNNDTKQTCRLSVHGTVVRRKYTVYARYRAECRGVLLLLFSLSLLYGSWFRAHVNNYRGAENAVRENHGVKLHDSVKVVKSLSESTRKRR